LKRSGLKQLRELLVDQRSSTLVKREGIADRKFAFSLAMFEHANDYIGHYRALAGGRGGAVSLDTIRLMLSELVRDELATSAGRSSSTVIPCEFVVQYVVGAYMAVLTWWLDNGAKLPPRQIDTMFRHLLTKGVTPLRAIGDT
jgi:hypothetical protein